jgi:hypothetical protein
VREPGGGLFPVFLVLIWSAVAIRLPTLWRDRRQRALSSGGLALALAITAAYPPVAHAMNAPLVPHALGVLAAYFQLRFIALVTGTTGRWWLTGPTAAVLLSLGVLAVASGGIPTRTGPLTRHLTPGVVAYWVLLESYLGAVLVVATVLFWTVARGAPAGAPRNGLRTIAAGSFLIALYAALKATLIVLHALGVRVNFGAIEPPAHTGQALGMLLVIAGGLATATRRARAAAAAYRSLLELRPLWKAMRDTFPEIILFTPRRAVIELAGVDDVHLRLYRRVIEIRDGMLALRDHRPPTAALAGDAVNGDPVTGEHGTGDPAVAEARGIALALRGRAAGEPAAEQPGAWAPVGPDMADEVAWLRRVSLAYRRLGGRAVVTDVVRTPRPSGSVR